MSTPFYDLASLVVVPSGYKASKVYAQKPLTTDGQLTFTRASTATRVNASGLIETVASGVPRLDYTNSSCPKILLEPQRSNLVTWSEALDNATWTKTEVTVTANQAVSPDGSTNADLLADNTALASHFTQQTFFSASSQLVTISGYFKDKDIRYAGFRLFVPDAGAGVGRFSIVVDLQTGAITSTLASGATIANLSYDVTLVGNGWYRARITGTCPIGTTSIMAWLSPSATPTNDGFATASYVGTGKGCYLYGFQAELGAYATSYVKTEAAAVTRLADVAEKSSISSLIGSTAGTAFIDVQETNNPSGTTNTDILLLQNSVNSALGTYSLFLHGSTGNIRIYFLPENTSITMKSGNNRGQRLKIAFAYASGDFVCYVNGTQVYTSTGRTLGAGLDKIALNASPNSGLEPVNQTLLFKTRLTNAQLAELTTL
jgi:hypothetical protein